MDAKRLPEEEADAALVQRFQRGDAQAFEMLVRRHQDRIFRLAGVWLYQPNRAGDATQDVFLRAFKGFPRFRFRAAPFTWLYRVTRNVCAEYNRRYPKADREEAVDEADFGLSPEQLTDQQRSLDRVRMAVEMLPKRQREVVLLRMFEELSTAETASAMGCRAGTVKALLHKALTKIRTLDHV